MQRLLRFTGSRPDYILYWDGVSGIILCYAIGQVELCLMWTATDSQSDYFLRIYFMILFRCTSEEALCLEFDKR